MFTKNPLDVALEYAIAGEREKSKQILLNQPQEDPRVVFNLGWHDLAEGRMHEGFGKLNAGRWIDAFGSRPLKTDAPIWRGPNPIILLRLEGGLGDQIVNVRFAKNLSQYGDVIVLCDATLVELFSKVEGVSHAQCECEGIPYHDYWVPGMSAPFVLNMEYEDLSGEAYLNVSPRKLDGDFKVGLRWSGNPKFEHEQHRKFDPELMIKLSKMKGATFYSLQRDSDLQDIDFKDLSSEMKTWEDTASIIKGLDLVITSDTSVAHCAGALGVETWMVIPVLPYYLWALPGDTTPWYNSIRLFRQETYGSWKEPFKNISTELRKKINNRNNQNLS
jgi:hypothetical protein